VATGTFSEYTLWKENAPDTEFGETFEWKPEFNAISKEYWVDKAVGAYCVSQFLGETKVACPLSSIAVKKFMRRTAVPHGAQRYSCAGGATKRPGENAESTTASGSEARSSHRTLCGRRRRVSVVLLQLVLDRRAELPRA